MSQIQLHGKTGCSRFDEAQTLEKPFYHLVAKVYMIQRILILEITFVNTKTLDKLSFIVQGPRNPVSFSFHVEKKKKLHWKQPFIISRLTKFRQKHLTLFSPSTSYKDFANAAEEGRKIDSRGRSFCFKTSSNTYLQNGVNKQNQKKRVGTVIQW